MTDNIVGRIDPNIPQFWVQCEAWDDWPERVLISNKVRGETIGEVWYIPERTCKIIKSKKLPYLDKEMMCSECGKLWLEKGVDNYCPNCGARVIEE